MTKSNYAMLLLIAGLFFITGNTSAQKKLSLTAEQAIETGLQNSKTLHSSLMKVKYAKAKHSESISIALPSLTFTGAYRRLSYVDPFSINLFGMDYNITPSILDAYTAQFTLVQPLFTGFKILKNIDLTDQLSNAADEDYNKDKCDLVYDIKNSYWNLFKATELDRIMNETVEQVKAHVEDAKNLVAAGLMTQNDMLKIEVQLSDVTLKQIDAENAVKLSMVALNSIIGIDLNTQIEIASVTQYVDSEYKDLEKLIDEAVEKRSEIKSADYRIKAGEAGVTIAESSWYPQISLIGNYYYSKPNQRIFPSRNQFDATWDAGVNVSVNVWNWLTTAHQTEQARTQLSQSIDAKGIIEDGITLEVTQNYLSFNQAKRRIDVSELGVKQADENMRNTEDKFKNGLATSTDVVDAETALNTAKVSYTNSLVDYELAKAKLNKSIAKY
jgi:outer membrane protein TolC